MSTLKTLSSGLSESNCIKKLIDECRDMLKDTEDYESRLYLEWRITELEKRLKETGQ
jgi:hypothetical protein